MAALVRHFTRNVLAHRGRRRPAERWSPFIPPAGALPDAAMAEVTATDAASHTMREAPPGMGLHGTATDGAGNSSRQSAFPAAMSMAWAGRCGVARLEGGHAVHARAGAPATAGTAPSCGATISRMAMTAMRYPLGPSPAITAVAIFETSERW